MPFFDKTRNLARKALLSSGGPMLVAGANFLVSLAAIPVMTTADFGTLAFLMALAQLGVAVATGVVGTAMSIETQYDRSNVVRDAFFCGTVLFSAVAAGLLGGIAYAISSDPMVGGFFGAYGLFLVHRSIDRSWFICTERPLRAVRTDVIYCVAMTAAMGLLYLRADVDLRSAGMALAGSACVALLTGSYDLMLPKLRSLHLGAAKRYLSQWRTSVGWTFMGVLATDLTLNAHAYVVTVLIGPAAYAPIAVAALAWRPFVIVLYSVASFERPALARAHCANDPTAVNASVRSLTMINGIVYVGTALVGGGALLYGLGGLDEVAYPTGYVLTLFGLIAATMFVRSLREPLVQSLNAARRYREVTYSACLGAATGVIASAILALQFGALYSLGGVLLGDVVFFGAVAMTTWYRPQAKPSAAIG